MTKLPLDTSDIRYIDTIHPDDVIYPMVQIKTFLEEILDGERSIERLRLGNGGELTISGGSATVTKPYHTVDTEADAASDELITINGGADGRVILLQQENTAREVELVHTASLELPQGVNVPLNQYGILVAVRDADNTEWVAGKVSNGLTQLGLPDEVTISGGHLGFITRHYHTVDTEADAASDNLDSMASTTNGRLLVLQAENTNRTVVIRHAVNNIFNMSGGNVSLDSTEKLWVGVYDIFVGWIQIGGATS